MAKPRILDRVDALEERVEVIEESSVGGGSLELSGIEERLKDVEDNVNSAVTSVYVSDLSQINYKNLDGSSDYSRIQGLKFDLDGKTVEFRMSGDAGSYGLSLATTLKDGTVKYYGLVKSDGSCFIHVVSTYRSGNTWYRIWSDGWVEQGGIDSSGSGTKQITFPRAFSSKAYALTAIPLSETAHAITYTDLTKTGVKLINQNSTCLWTASGY